MLKKDRKDLFKISIVERENKKAMISEKTNDFLDHTQQHIFQNS